MKKAVSFLYLLAAASAALAAQQPAGNIYDRPARFERSREFDVRHYRIDCRLDPETETMRAETAITLSAMKDGLARIVLDADQFEVEEVLGPDGVSRPFEMAGGRLSTVLAAPLSYGEAAVVTVRYELAAPKKGLRFIAETPEAPAQAATYNWPEEAHRWFPCFDAPNDKASSELRITVPYGWKALSNGRLVEETADAAAGTAVFHWLQDKPHPTYNVMMVAGPFVVLPDKLGDLPVNYWVYPSAAADAPRTFHKTPRMIDFYNATFGYPYPWAKYDQICTAGTGGGMEATSATMLGDDTVQDARAGRDFSSDSLIAHELAHQWWGNLVTERHWTDVWLSESFATYSEYLWTRFDRGGDEGALNLLDKKNQYLWEAKNRYVRPLVFNRFNNPWEVMDAHSYPKGAVILHMLRDVLGDKAFFASMKLFLHRFEFRTADTHDFINAVRDAAGVNPDWFFEQWIFRPGHPVFDVDWAWDEAGRTVRLRVAQVQDAARGIPIFRVPVRIGIVTSSGTRIEKIEVTKAEETFVFNSDGRPLSVRFDEGWTLLAEIAFHKPTEELLFDLTDGEAVGRLWAAGQLASHCGETGVAAALRATAGNDPCWAVRRGALEALPAGSASAAEDIAFFKKCALDPSSKVRAAAVGNLGDLEDKRLSAFFQKRFSDDDSYVVQAACLAALGKSGDRGAGEFLRKAAALPSPRGMLKRAAVSALKALGL